LKLFWLLRRNSPLFGVGDEIVESGIAMKRPEIGIFVDFEIIIGG